jgi:two-component system KDP operon response regulator KdpE
VTTVLVVDDDPALVRALTINLRARGYEVHAAATGAGALTLAAQYPPDAVVLDLGLPDMDGNDVIAGLRGWTAVPILVLSAREQSREKVAALDAGADDYVTKPFGMNELLARLRVALRHAQAAQVSSASSVLDLGGLTIDLEHRRVRVGEREVHLTPIEYRLLTLLAQHADRVLTHRHILKHVWGPRHGEQTHYLRVRMAELRKKIEHDPARPVWLLTETGIGYRLRAGPARQP